MRTKPEWPDDETWERWPAFLIILAVLFSVDWLLGMAIVRGWLPGWVMTLANPPFGYVYTWTEAQWAGGNYVIGGRIVGEDLIMAAQCLAVAAQALVVFGVWRLWRRWSTGLHQDS